MNADMPNPAVSTENELHNVDYMMSGVDFEVWCADVLRLIGYDDVRLTDRTNDHGVDITAYRDGVKYGFQCKCYSKNVGNKAVQEIISGIRMYQCQKAVVITNQYFTKNARLEARNDVELWDRDVLRHYLNVIYAAQEDSNEDDEPEESEEPEEDETSEDDEPETFLQEDDPELFRAVLECGNVRLYRDLFIREWKQQEKAGAMDEPAIVWYKSGGFRFYEKLYLDEYKKQRELLMEERQREFEQIYDQNVEKPEQQEEYNAQEAPPDDEIRLHPNDQTPEWSRNINLWPYDIAAAEIDYDYYRSLPRVRNNPRFPLYITCVAVGGDTKYWNPYPLADSDPEIYGAIELFPLKEFETAEAAEHFLRAAQREYFAICHKHYGDTSVSITVRADVVRKTFAPGKNTFVLKNWSSNEAHLINWASTDDSDGVYDESGTTTTGAQNAPENESTRRETAVTENNVYSGTAGDSHKAHNLLSMNAAERLTYLAEKSLDYDSRGYNPQGYDPNNVTYKTKPPTGWMKILLWFVSIVFLLVSAVLFLSGLALRDDSVIASGASYLMVSAFTSPAKKIWNFFQKCGMTGKRRFILSVLFCFLGLIILGMTDIPG